MDLSRIAKRIASSKVEEAKKVLEPAFKDALKQIGPLALSNEDSKAMKDWIRKFWGL